MLQLKNVIKTYTVGDTLVSALRGVGVSFRDSEFVSVLGPSGCGKTTLLNIIGGLDRYTSGDLIINGRSTKEYKDSDWDTYRNHSVGFVFQSYNLIPHQTVLSNVEIALTLSGVPKAERKKRATEALQKVGLGDQLKKKPNQMSGGQMQRVAIARALVNDPEILLADEPTGALDSETSIQIMDILREIAKNRLVIMVTHNRELAEKYSTRIVSLLDGKITGDTAPYSDEEIAFDLKKSREEQAKGKKSMKFTTALSLSFNNLMTKRTRTLLTSFAGSIGIIGIALILALSTGVQKYIDDVQRDTLTSYPITIEAEESDLSSMLSMIGRSSGANDREEREKEPRDEGYVYSNSQMYRMFNTIFAAEKSTNNLTDFKKFIDKEMNPETSETGLYKAASSIQYDFDVDPMCYVMGPNGKYIPCDISEVFSSFGSTNQGSDMMYNMMQQQTSMINLWTELLPGKDGELLAESVKEDYELVYGRYPTEKNEIILILDNDYEISDLAFYSLGFLDSDEVKTIMTAALRQEEIEAPDRKLDFDEALGITFKLILPSDLYADDDKDNVWNFVGDDETRLEMIVKGGYDLIISGIVRRTESGGSPMNPNFGYSTALTDYIIEETEKREIIKFQAAEENANYDVFTGLPFIITDAVDPTDEYKSEKIFEYFETINNQKKTEIFIKINSIPSEEEFEAILSQYMTQYDSREKMQELIGTLYGLDTQTAADYLSAYTDEELTEMMRERMTEMIYAQFESEAKAYAESIMLTPSDEELEMIISKITSSLVSDQYKIGYVLSDWKTNTQMDESAITAYLMSLSAEELDAAVYSVAAKSAAATYAGMAQAYSESGYEKIAVLFDDFYKSETDTQVLASYYDIFMPSIVSETTLSGNLKTLGAVSADSPSSINIYAASFDDKDRIAEIITQYNEQVEEDDQIDYTDYMALLMSGITNIINAISYGLIAFVSISLVVSSIMIGIITYISVLERTKEIGVLRSVGASKKDVSLVFNAETIIVGFVAGVIGIGISLLLCIPISLIIHVLSGITEINAFLLPEACVILIGISMVLTLIAGLIPSGIAAKKDPVEALRTE